MKNSEPVVNTKINWKRYNKALANRASIFSLLPKNFEQTWYQQEATGQPGAPKTYSDQAVITCLTVAEALRLPLRQTECFLNNTFEHMGLDIRCPNYTVLCRRRMTLAINRTVYEHTVHDDAVLVDSSGMKATGDGEWHRKYHNVDKPRQWLKVHIGVSWNTRQIIACYFTHSTVVDGNVLPELLKQVPSSVKECIGDGAYDIRSCYAVADKLGLKPIFAIRTGAVLHPEEPLLEPRNTAITAIASSPDGSKAWKRSTGYHRRSLVENAFFRCKIIFGPRVSARRFSSQVVQMTLRINLLNKFMAQNG